MSVESQKKVLCVDDEPQNLRLYEKLLNKSGHEVITLNSGKAAIDYLKDTAVDLIILDLEMPGMTGFLTLSSIKREALNKQTPILICSSHQEKEFIDRAFQLGCSGYLNKPIVVDEFRDSVAEALS